MESKLDKAAQISDSSADGAISASLGTVRNHVQRALHKFDAGNRLEAVAFAVSEDAIVQRR